MNPNEEKTKTRNRLYIIIAILTVVSAIAIGVLLHALRTDPGWREVTVSPGTPLSAASSLRFYFQVQSQYGGKDFRSVTRTYTEAAVRAYALFDTLAAHEGINGLYAVNAAPGETLKVEPELYEAFRLMEESSSRAMYLAPVYAVYDDLFLSSDDLLAKQYDPYYDPDTAAYFTELLTFLKDPAHIRLELLGDNKVVLHLSEAYRRFAAENGISVFLDFHWMKNAFFLDLIGDRIRADGYTKGYLVSQEGWVLCLDDSGETYNYKLPASPGAAHAEALMHYTGPAGIICLKNYTADTVYDDYYFAYSSDNFATAYIDPADGFYKSAVPELLLYSDRASCAQLLLAACRLMIREEFDAAEAEALNEEGLYAVFYEKNSLCHYGPAVFTESAVSP